MQQVKVAIVGIGGRGKWLVESVARREDAAVTALCDVIPQKAEYMAGAIDAPETPVFADISELLEKSECDVVMVTTADAHHAEVVVPAFQAGKVVFCEKPLETTRERCRAIIDADQEAGGKTFVGFNLRYAPVYSTCKRLIEEGAIGRVLTLQADEFYDGGRTYFRRWNRLRSEGGGLWITKASHDFDLLAWLAGVKPVQVYAVASRTYYQPRAEAAAQCRNCKLADSCPDRAPVEPTDLLRIREENGGEPYDLCLYNTPSDTFDHGIATLRFADDVFATYTCNVVAGFSNRRIRVSGTTGTLTGDLHSNTIRLNRRDPSREEEIPVGGDLNNLHGGADGNVLDSFFAFAKGTGAPKCRPAEAYTAIAMGLGATMSADESRVVDLSEVGV